MTQKMVTKCRMEKFSQMCHIDSDVSKTRTGACDALQSCNGELSPLSCDITDTPTKRNKRKLSEPKKRTTDFSIKRFCPESPVGSAGDSETSDDLSESVPLTVDLSVNSVKTPCRTPLKVPTVPFQTQCRRDRYFTKTDGRGSDDRSPPVCEADNSQLAANILNTDGCGATPVQRFGRYPSETTPSEDGDMYSNSSSKHRKNYKNMTRARRVEANARERTRVHTISAAFEALRRAVPSYSYNQKLSKLAILRIASTYILSLARLADMDSGCSNAPNTMSFSECVDLCTQTIQTEGRARRRH